LAQILSRQASPPGGREQALDSKRNNFIHSATPQARDNGRIDAAKQWHSSQSAYLLAVYRIEPCFAKQKACQRIDTGAV
jgi:hypothetical protein